MRVVLPVPTKAGLIKEQGGKMVPGRARKCNYDRQLTRQTESSFHSPLPVLKKSQEERLSAGCIEKVTDVGGSQIHTSLSRISEKAE